MVEQFFCDYECHYCGYSFTAKAGKGWTNKDVNQSSGSNTISCPRCGNNLRTWKDAKNKREI